MFRPFRPFRHRVGGLVAAVVVALTAASCATDDAADEGSEPASGPSTVASQPADEEASEAAGGEGGGMAGMATEDMAGMDDDMGGMGDDGMAMGMAAGQPADPSEATRTIEVNVDNDLRFEPDTFEVARSEVVTFVVSNTGDVEHEFVLGDEQMQQAMAEQMAEGDDHMHAGDMSNAVTVHAGETGEITWRFSEPGTVLIGCHVAGHWEAGMRGSVVVT